MINIVYRLQRPKFFEEAIDEIELEGVVDYHGSKENWYLP